MNGPLTHLDEHGQARMVDVGAKAVTQREAVATSFVACAPGTLDALRAGNVPKGDALAVARIAGIQGAKRTPDLVPLCHTIALTSVNVEADIVDGGVAITATTRTVERTGVEMEALTAASVAALALYDMIKGIDRGARITETKVVEKRGGRSGHWMAEGWEGCDDTAAATADAHGAPGKHVRNALVITCSDRCSRGEAEDTSGPIIVEKLAGLGILDHPAATVIVPDDARAISLAISGAATEGASLVITTGGTGISPRDVTPEATEPLLTARLDHIAAGMIRYGERFAPRAVISRGLAGMVGRTIVINLPGSAKAVTQSMDYLAGLLPHMLDQVAGGDHVR